jgi:hypothetical protein
LFFMRPVAKKWLNLCLDSFSFIIFAKSLKPLKDNNQI